MKSLITKPAVVSTTSTCCVSAQEKVAQCCAKVSKNVAGCHD